jgi:hypothetical protein
MRLRRNKSQTEKIKELKEKRINFLMENKLRNVQKITEQQELITLVKELYELSIANNPLGGTVVALSKGDTNVAGAAAAFAIIYLAYRLSKGFAQKLKPKKCRQYKLGSPAQKKCHHEVDVAALEKILSILKSKMYLCNHSKDKVKCELKLKKKMGEVQQKISAKQARIKQLQFQV